MPQQRPGSHRQVAQHDISPAVVFAFGPRGGYTRGLLRITQAPQSVDRGFHVGALLVEFRSHRRLDGDISKLTCLAGFHLVAA